LGWNNRMRIYVHIKPNCSRAGLISEVQLPAERFGLFSNEKKLITALRVSVSSAPVDGQANEELIRIIAKQFDVPKSKVSIVYGLKGRFKVLKMAD
jgi:uncharacterized protein (TIGR00251 family)